MFVYSEQPQHFLVLHLGKLPVPRPDGVEGLGGRERNEFVGALTQHFCGIGWADREGNDNAVNFGIPQILYCSKERNTRRCAIVDEEDGSAPERRAGGDEVGLAAALELRCLLLDYRLHVLPCHPGTLHHAIIEVCGASLSYCAEAVLAMPRVSELADDVRVERELQCIGDGPPDHDTSAHHREDDGARFPLVRLEHSSKLAAGDAAVGEGEGDAGHRRSAITVGELLGEGKRWEPKSGVPRPIFRYSSIVRIASLSPAATEILFGLGVGQGQGQGKNAHHVVCVDQFSNFPEEAKAIPHVRDMVKVDPEELRRFEPELVLLTTSIQARLAETLRGAGFSVVYDDPRTVEQIYAWIRSLGALLGREREAEAIVLSMQRGFNDVKRKAALLPRRPQVYIEEWPALPNRSGGHDSPYASGNWVPEITHIAGGVQLPFPPEAEGRDAPEARLSWPVTFAEVQKWNPELIVISWCGAGALASKEVLLKRLGWGSLPAVARGHVRVMDDSLLNRPGPRLVEGAQRLYGWVFEILH
jgi:iron complex transport system substrate-binding protein